MDTVVALSSDRLVATHYGFYNTIVGVGILLGNLATGAVFGALHGVGLDSLIWIALALVGILCAAALYALDRTGGLTATPNTAIAHEQRSAVR
jgi:uncharacterized membrane protein (Fun14 family)